MDDNNIEIFFRRDDHKVSIVINNKEYLVSPHFSMNDGEKFIAEFVKENDYKRALAIIISKKIQDAQYDNIPTLEDIIVTEEKNFWEYILAVVSDSDELSSIFDETDEELPLRHRFAIAYKTYMDRIAKRLAESLRPLTESLNQVRKNIDFSWMSQMQEFANKLKPAWMNAIEQSNRIYENIANALHPFPQITKSFAKIISNFQIASISQEEISQWEESYGKWGKLGWPVIPNAPFNFYNNIPDDNNVANKLAMEFCDTKAMEELFKNMHEQKIKKTDLDSAIFCYKNRQYKACALLLFGLLDSKIIRLQPKKINRAVGLGGAKKLRLKLEDKLADEHFLFTTLYGMNFVTCLETYFEKGNNFISEPEVINRNFINHGMNMRNVRKRDCVQLFIALYNMEEFINNIL